MSHLSQSHLIYNFSINLIETDILNSLMKIMALPRSKLHIKFYFFAILLSADPKNIDKDPPVLHFLGAVLGIIYMAINCSLERSQKILADNQFQFAVWKMMDYKHECRQERVYYQIIWKATQKHE